MSRFRELYSTGTRRLIPSGELTGGEDLVEEIDLSLIDPGAAEVELTSIDGVEIKDNIFCMSIVSPAITATGSATGSGYWIELGYDDGMGGITYPTGEITGYGYTGSSPGTPLTSADHLVKYTLNTAVTYSLWNLNSVAPKTWTSAQQGTDNGYRGRVNNLGAVKAIKLVLNWTGGAGLSNLGGTLYVVAKKLTRNRQKVTTYDLTDVANQVNKITHNVGNRAPLVNCVFMDTSATGGTTEQLLRLGRNNTEYSTAGNYNSHVMWLNTTQANSNSNREDAEYLAVISRETTLTYKNNIILFNMGLNAPVYGESFAHHSTPTGLLSAISWGISNVSGLPKMNRLHFIAGANGTDTWNAGTIYVVEARFNTTVASVSPSAAASPINIVDGSVGPMMSVCAVDFEWSVQQVSGLQFGVSDTYETTGVYDNNRNYFTGAAWDNIGFALLATFIGDATNHFGSLLWGMGEAIHKATWAGSVCPIVSGSSYNTTWTHLPNETVYNQIQLMNNGTTPTGTGTVYSIIYI